MLMNANMPEFLYATLKQLHIDYDLIHIVAYCFTSPVVSLTFEVARSSPSERSSHSLEEAEPSQFTILFYKFQEEQS